MSNKFAGILKCLRCFLSSNATANSVDVGKPSGKGAQFCLNHIVAGPSWGYPTTGWMYIHTKSSCSCIPVSANISCGLLKVSVCNLLWDCTNFKNGAESRSSSNGIIKGASPRLSRLKFIRFISEIPSSVKEAAQARRPRAGRGKAAVNSSLSDMSVILIDSRQVKPGRIRLKLNAVLSRVHGSLEHFQARRANRGQQWAVPEIASIPGIWILRGMEGSWLTVCFSL